LFIDELQTATNETSDKGNADMNTETAAPTIHAIEQEKKNGVSRPFPGTKTGLVWDYADAILKARTEKNMKHVVPVISEVQKLYNNVVGAVPATCRQQFQFWCKFHGLRDAWAARVAEEGNEADADKIAARKAKEEAKLKKAQETAEKAKARAEKQKADAEARVKKAEETAKKAQEAAEAAKKKADDMLAKANAAANAAKESAAPATEQKPAEQAPAAQNGKPGKAA
jgi:hypothetical protein